MTTSLAPTASDAIRALEPARRVYGKFGYSDQLEGLIVAHLTKELEPGMAGAAVEGLIQLLWSYFPGGSTAEVVAAKVLRELDQEELARKI